MTLRCARTHTRTRDTPIQEREGHVSIHHKYRPTLRKDFSLSLSLSLSLSPHRSSTSSFCSRSARTCSWRASISALTSVRSRDRYVRRKQHDLRPVLGFTNSSIKSTSSISSPAVESTTSWTWFSWKPLAGTQNETSLKQGGYFENGANVTAGMTSPAGAGISNCFVEEKGVEGEGEKCGETTCNP